MKKIITLTTALATITAANAIQKVQTPVYDQVGEKMEFVAKSAQKKENVKAIAKSSSKADLKAAAAAKAPAVEDVTPLYTFPDGTFYSYIGIDAANGLYSYPGSVILPPYVDNTWYNMSWYINENNRIALAKGVECTWEEIINGNSVNSTNDFNFTSANDPSLYAGYGKYTPVLTCGQKSYQAGSEGRDGIIPFFVEYGGYGAANPELLDDLASALVGQTGTINKFNEGNSFPYNRFSDDFILSNTSFAFDYPGEANDPIEKNYLDANETSDDIKVIGFCQDFPAPSAPYALSSLSIDVNTTCEANAKLQFDFYAVNNNVVETETPIYSYTHTFAEAQNNGDVTINIPFTTKDEIGDEINYILVDKEMMMVITGFTDSSFKTFAPYIAFFYYDRTASYYCPEPRFVTALVADKEGASFRETNYICGWTPQGSNETIWTTYNSMDIQMEVEYPYIKPYMNLVNEEEYDADAKVYSIGLTTDEPEAILAVLCPGDIENINVTTVDGEDLPQWLACETVAAADLEAGDAGPVDEGQKYFYLYFGLENEVPETPVNCYVKVEYKGQSSLFFVTTGDPTGIDNVTAVEKAELDWNAPVYNVMGQKISKGYKGIAIQNGNKFIVK